MEGTVQVYGIRNDGSASPVNQIKSSTLLGDLEFPGQETMLFYTEAKTRVIALALFTVTYRKQFEKDISFLHMFLRSYAVKLKNFSLADTVQ